MKATKTVSLSGYTTSGKVSVASGATLALNAGGTGEFASADLDTLRSNASFSSGSFLGIDTTNAGGSFSYGSNITEPIGLIKLGTGTFTISGSNTYSGTTAVNAGTLQAAKTASLSGYTSAGKVSVAGGATLAVNVGGTGEFASGDLNTLRGNASFSSGSFLGIDTTNAGGNFAYGSNITESIGLTKLGSGTLTLSGANSYNGGTNLSAGVLSFANGALGSTGAVAFTGNSTLQWNGNNTQDVSSRLAINNGITGTIDTNGNDVTFASAFGASGSGILAKTGLGTLTLSNANTFTGGANVNGGTLKITNASALGTGAVAVNAGTLDIAGVALTANNLTLNNGATLKGSSGASSFSKTNFPAIGASAGTAVTFTTGANSDVFSINSAIRAGVGTATITVNGPGTINLSSGSTTSTAYAGSWLLNGVSSTVLKLSDANALGNPTNTTPRPIDLRGGTLVLGVSTGSTFSSATTISGDVAITPDRGSSGTSNTHTMGTLSIGSFALTVAQGSNYTSGNTGSLTFGTTTLTGNALFTLNNVSGAGVGVTTLGALDDGGSIARTITKGGSGTLTLSANATSLINGTELNITAGTVNSNMASALGDKAKVALTTGATFNVGANQTIGALNNTAADQTGSVTLGSNALTVGNTNNLNSNFAGVISGVNGQIAKAGNGTMTLRGTSPNTYTGLTTVSAGELDLNKTDNVNALGGNATVSGGTLKWLANEQMGDTGTSLMLTSGVVDLNGKTETLGSFTNNGGTFTTGNGGHLIGTGASVTWSSGTNTVSTNSSVEDGHVVITGGDNTVQTSGTLRVLSSGTGLEMTGGTLKLDSHASAPGILLLENNVTTIASSGTSMITSNGAAAVPGLLDLGGGERTFTVNDGPAVTDLLISAQITNGALVKAGTGRMTLTGVNDYLGVTTVGSQAAGAATITSATANGGTLEAAANGALGSGGTFTSSMTPGVPSAVATGGAGTPDPSS